MTSYIKAPYNFVPINKQLVQPDKPEAISHTVPFKDGVSGSIDITIEALSPIFTRNKLADQEKVDIHSFCHVKDKNDSKKYFIPGTSLKGMFRSVLEIMTYGYLRIDKRMKFAVRDLGDKELYPIMKATEQGKMRCGWLHLNEDAEGTIHDHGLPMRINHIRLDELFEDSNINVSFSNYFSQKAKVDLNSKAQVKDKEYDRKDAAFKYALLEGHLDKLEKLNFSRDSEYYAEPPDGSANPPAHSERRLKVDDNGDIKGSIVFTGQPDPWFDPRGDRPRKIKDGKFYEFVFPSERKGTYKLSQVELGYFSFIYQDSEAWEFFKKRGKIPVFFRIEKGRIKDLGLALLYKLPYHYSAQDLAQKTQGISDYKDVVDMADSLFGFIQKKSAGKSLKGRVQVGHAFAKKAVEFDKPMIKRLGSPKASYLPIYIDQSQLGRNGITPNYKSYNEKDSVLSGWKRYPLRFSPDQIEPTDGYNPKLDTRFLPLDKGSTFKAKVYFHNLRPFELGALLSAITFHGNQDDLCHSLGMSKSFGFGKVKVSVDELSCDQDILEYLVVFEEFMNKALGEKSWIKQPRLQELFSMAKNPETTQRDIILKYMTMSNERENNEFLKAKQGKEYLQRFSTLSKDQFIAKSLIESKIEEEIAKREARELEESRIFKQQQREEAELAKKREKENKLNRELERQAAIDEGIEKKLNDIESYENVEAVIREYKRNVEDIPEGDQLVIQNSLNRVINPASFAKKEKKQWRNFKKGKWLLVKSWIGEDKAKAVYKETGCDKL
jgi:CRISPR-associated protein (TIGR03986 family)